MPSCPGIFVCSFAYYPARLAFFSGCLVVLRASCPRFGLPPVLRLLVQVGLWRCSCAIPGVLYDYFGCRFVLLCWSALIKQEGRQTSQQAAHIIQAFDLAATIIPALSAVIVGGGGPELLDDSCWVVAEEIGHGVFSLLDADGDIAGAVDIEEGASGGAAGHAAVEGMIELAQEVGVAQEISVVSA